MRASTICAVVTVLGFVGAVGAMPPQSGSTKAAPKETTTDKYKEAKDSLRRARTLLSDYVAENPNSADAHVARLQLAALQNIFATDVAIPPVKLRDSIVWRIVRVTPGDANTKVTVEFENTSDSELSAFVTFAEYPLVLVASKKTYAMRKELLARPREIKEGHAGGGWNGWAIQPTQAVQMDIYFDALDEGALEGFIKYDGNNDFGAIAPRFSLINSTQSAKP